MDYFLQPEFWSRPHLLMLFIISLTCAIYGRYLLTCVLYKFILEWWLKTTRNSMTRKKKQIIREMGWSFFSSLLFAGLFAACLLLYQRGYTKVYEHMEDYALWYFYTSPLLVIIGYDAYYYWIHRWMHMPSVFRIVHRVHHESLEPTVFTAFSFHPLEAFVQFLFFPLIILVLPLHLYAIATVFVLLTISAMINHGGYEFYSSPIIRNNVIGSTHHDKHHHDFKRNYGLLFTWWDLFMRTSAEKKR